ncbi:MAG: ATP-dependent DNA helicase RecG [Anaerolineae bacterium]
MPEAGQLLLRVLEQEAQTGYRNQAVIGGLSRFLDRWPEEEADSELPVSDIRAALAPYADLSPAERAETIETVRELLGGLAGADGSPASDEIRVDLDSPVTELHGVSATYARRLARLNVRSIRDLLYLFPARHEDYTEKRKIADLEYGQDVTVMAKVWEVHSRSGRRGRDITTAVLSDGSGTVQATWFNQPYMAKQLKPGRSIVISGRVGEYMGRLSFQAPAWEAHDSEWVHVGRLVPIYPLTRGLKAGWIRRLMKRTVDYWSLRLPDHLPARRREKAKLEVLEEAVREIHFPDTLEDLAGARRRLAFDEFLMIQLGALRQRQAWRSERGQPLPAMPEVLQGFRSALPFRLTAAQDRVIEEILGDMAVEEPMNRLLQGDVGSGKTVVAAAAMVTAVANGAQGVLMAPTQILAEQHHRTLTGILETVEIHDPALDRTGPPDVRLLTSGTVKEEREAIYRDALQSAQILVGTHALIQEGLDYRNLGLAVIDEQHRFGVEQRKTLRTKGTSPHLLVMSATPIPRSLALTIYGDLDLSVIDEMPPGRKEILTRWMYPREAERAYAFIQSQVEKGHQAFIVFPLVEETGTTDAKAAVQEHARLQEEIFPDLRLGLLHGRMTPEEKDRTMRRFADGGYDILVSTSVIEVGVDVPNATVLLAEGADRFGLAQLHQFRGRVGRGEAQSHCILLSEAPSHRAEARLRAIEETQDGFALADIDLEMRGPGEFFGTQQSGMLQLRLARLGDLPTLEEARGMALDIFREDPDLEKPDHRLLAERVNDFWAAGGDPS